MPSSTVLSWIPAEDQCISLDETLSKCRHEPTETKTKSRPAVNEENTSLFWFPHQICERRIKAKSEEHMQSTDKFSPSMQTMRYC